MVTRATRGSRLSDMVKGVVDSGRYDVYVYMIGRGKSMCRRVCECYGKVGLGTGVEECE